jgi:hypothetical protein
MGCSVTHVGYLCPILIFYTFCLQIVLLCPQGIVVPVGFFPLGASCGPTGYCVPRGLPHTGSSSTITCIRVTHLNDLHSSANIIRVIKSRRMRWAGHVERRGEKRGSYTILVGRPEGRHHLGDPGIDGRIILK